MRKILPSFASILAVSVSLTVSACGKHDSADNGIGAVPANTGVTPAATIGTAPVAGTPVTAADTVARVHHSMLKGALAGAVAGHIAGGHALAGAAAGAMVQHERNKHP